MNFTDDGYAAMLLTMALSPNREEYARPYSTQEFRAIEAGVRASRYGDLGRLLNADVSGLMMYLNMTEQEALRAYTLLHRTVQLSYALEKLQREGVEVVTCRDGDYPARLRQCAERIENLRGRLREQGWHVEPSDPLRLTLAGDGAAMAAWLRRGGVEPEFTDRDGVVMMLTPENDPRDLARIAEALGQNDLPPKARPILPLPKTEPVLTPRQALFSPCETVPAEEALGRICGAPTVACPPAVPIVISGERIGEEALALFRYYGIPQVTVLK